MRAITYSSFRNNLKENIRQIREDAEPLLVINKDVEDNIVVMNQSDYDSLMEKVRIYRNPRCTKSFSAACVRHSAAICTSMNCSTRTDMT